MKRLILLTLALGLLFNPLIWAAPSPQPDTLTYLDRVDEKFDRGAINFVAGWTEMISEPMEHYRDDSTGKSRILKTAAGLGAGIFNAAVDITGGFFNALTAPLPAISFPLPENGVDLKPVTGASLEDSRITERNLDPLKGPSEAILLKETSKAA